MNSSFFKKSFSIFLLLLPIMAMAVFFLTSQFVLLDDHEIYRMHFGELNFFSAMTDDWQNMHRFRPVYWIVRQLQVLLFGLNPTLWYGANLLYLAISLIFFYHFLKNLSFKNFTAIILSWIAFLGFNSINGWIALGPQEGMALCFFSCSLFFLSKYLLSNKEKQFKLSILFFLLTSLTKETFPFLSLFLISILFLHSNRVEKLKKKLLIISIIPALLLPIFLFQSWQFYQWKAPDGGSILSNLINFRSLPAFIDYLKTEYHIVLSFVLLDVLAVALSFKKRIKQRNNLLAIFFYLFVILVQFLIYSYAEYIAPHYVQPVSFSIVLSLVLVLCSYSEESQTIVACLLLITVPNMLYKTISTVNMHNFNSRAIHEIEQKVGNSNKETVILVGRRSYDFEMIYSFDKRFEYLYPNKEVYFYHFDQFDTGEGIFDVGSEIPELRDMNTELFKNSAIISFSDEFLIKNNLEVGALETRPILKNMDTFSTWHASAPSYSLQE